MEKLCDNKKNCFGCGACAAICPNKAISMEQDLEGFLYPCINAPNCSDCGFCDVVCPAKAKLERQKGTFYAIRCHDEQLLQHSTSGGAFSLLAEEVVEQNGMVCGAVFDKDFSVRHILSQNIAPMRKSKYVQSDISDCYAAIEEALRNDKQVLFTGTPCQCHAIKRFFPEACEKLLLASLICRGVESPGLWRDYIAWLSRGGQLKAYDFRDNRCGDDGHTVAYTIDDTETVVPMGEDKLSQMYNRRLTYRPSCYTCPYSCADNDFDFTLGDFWGIEKVYPKFADGQGTSLVIARGVRAEALIERVKRKAQVIPCDPCSAMQPALMEPAREPFLRRFLFRDYAKKMTVGNCGIPYILKKYTRRCIL